MNEDLIILAIFVSAFFTTISVALICGATNRRMTKLERLMSQSLNHIIDHIELEKHDGYHERKPLPAFMRELS